MHQGGNAGVVYKGLAPNCKVINYYQKYVHKTRYTGEYRI